MLYKEGFGARSMMNVQIVPIAAFSDNYLWLVVRGGRAAVIDPGDPAPVRRELARRGLTLAAILVTHHHGDHVGGVAALAQDGGAPVYGPRSEDIAARTRAVGEPDHIDVLGLQWQVLDVPGHTRGHIAFHVAAAQALFCGDTLFGAGCGRLFEGTPAQMLASLDKLAALPPSTRVYCAHEYTLSNLRFALAAEPANPALQARQQRCTAQRERGEPTLPSTLGEELATNPFMRCDQPALRAAAEARRPGAGRSRVETFAALREWKNGF
jgi:hydroxyacylglutathione hydrolase